MGKMRRFIKSAGFFVLLLVAIFGSVSSIVAAPQQFLSDKLFSQSQDKPQPLIVPPSPDIDAKGYVLMDFNSGKIIAQKNMDQRLSPASLTKLMTLYITFEALRQGQIKLTDKVLISPIAWRTGGSRMFVKVGSRVSVENLIRGVIVASGNDACVALAEYIAGTQANFAQFMNATAKRLGMKDSHFVDPTGLPKPNHYSTPHDLAILTRAVIQDFPNYYHYFNEKWIIWSRIKQANRNRLLWRDPSVDGLKTGHTEAAGYCLIASAKRQSMRLITVVMGTDSDSARASTTEALLNWGFRFYSTHRLFSANRIIANPRVWFGHQKHVKLAIPNDVYLTTPAGEYAKLHAVIKIPTELKAPIQRGHTYGSIEITYNGAVLKQVPLIAIEEDLRGDLWTRVHDRVALWFHKIL